MKKLRFFLIKLPLMAIASFVICSILAALIFPGTEKEVIGFQSDYFAGPDAKSLLDQHMKARHEAQGRLTMQKAEDESQQLVAQKQVDAATSAQQAAQKQADNAAEQAETAAKAARDALDNFS